MRADSLYNYLGFALGHCCLQVLFCKVLRAAGPSQKKRKKSKKEEVSWYSMARFRHKHCWDQADVLERCRTWGQSENPLVSTFIHPKPQKCKFPIFSSKSSELLEPKLGQLTNRNSKQAGRPASKEREKRFQREKCAKASLLKTRIICAMLSKLNVPLSTLSFITVILVVLNQR